MVRVGSIDKYCNVTKIPTKSTHADGPILIDTTDVILVQYHMYNVMVHYQHITCRHISVSLYCQCFVNIQEHVQDLEL